MAPSPGKEKGQLEPVLGEAGTQRENQTTQRGLGPRKKPTVWLERTEMPETRAEDMPGLSVVTDPSPLSINNPDINNPVLKH